MKADVGHIFRQSQSLHIHIISNRYGMAVWITTVTRHQQTFVEQTLLASYRTFSPSRLQ